MLPALDEAALASVPLFPLREVLFPGAPLPLHVFEPRYRRLVRDALAGSKLLSIPLLVDLGVEPPTIARVAGIGAIAEHVELPDGRFEILVIGLARAALEELPFEPPYRRARARVLGAAEGAPGREPEARAALLAAATRFVAIVRESEPDFRAALPAGLELGALTDLCARQLVVGPDDRQRVLESLDPLDRAELVTEQLVLQAHALGPDRDGPAN